MRYVLFLLVLLGSGLSAQTQTQSGVSLTCVTSQEVGVGLEVKLGDLPRIVTYPREVTICTPKPDSLRQKLQPDTVPIRVPTKVELRNQTVRETVSFVGIGLFVSGMYSIGTDEKAGLILLPAGVAVALLSHNDHLLRKLKLIR